MSPFSFILRGVRGISMIWECQIICIWIACLVSKFKINVIRALICDKLGIIFFRASLFNVGFVAPDLIVLNRCQVWRRCVLRRSISNTRVLIEFLSSPLYLLSVHWQFFLIQLLQVFDCLEESIHMLLMILLKYLFLIGVLLGTFSFAIKALQSVLQFL